MKLKLRIEKLSAYQVLIILIIDTVFYLAVAMTTITFQNGRKLTFNQNYFENESGDPRLIKVIIVLKKQYGATLIS